MTRSQGTPAVLSFSIQYALLPDLSRSSIAAFIARRFLTRSSLLRKSGWSRSVAP
jgi:hypothetical protein